MAKQLAREASHMPYDAECHLYKYYTPLDLDVAQQLAREASDVPCDAERRALGGESVVRRSQTQRPITSHQSLLETADIQTYVCREISMDSLWSL